MWLCKTWRNMKTAVNSVTTFLLHNFAFVPWTVRCYVTSEYRYAHPSNNKTKNCTLCVSMCSGVGLRFHHVFHGNEMFLPYLQSCLPTSHHQHRDWNETTTNSSNVRCELLSRFFSLPHTAGRLKVDSEKEAFSSRSTFQGVAVGLALIKSQSHPLAFSHVFLHDTRQCFFLSTLLWFSLLPGKAGNAKTIFRLIFFETKKVCFATSLRYDLNQEEVKGKDCSCIHWLVGTSSPVPGNIDCEAM